MRSLQNAKNIKEIISRKIEKKKRAKNLISSWNFERNISNDKLRNINEALRIRKSRGEGSWKLVPKDSCEIYKERRKRQQESKQVKKRGQRDTCSTRIVKDKHVKNNRRLNNNLKKKRKNKKGARKRWSRSESSMQSKVTCCSKTENSVSDSTSRGSGASVSDVDMDRE